MTDPTLATPPRAAAGFLQPVHAALLAAALLSACSRENAGNDATSQVAAKVDGTEISVHQINYLLKRTKASAETPEGAKTLRKQVLDKLIDQQLLVQKAVDDKLDRSPDVQLGLEAARRDVLVNAYLEQIGTTSPKPGDAEIRKYYEDHPELFARRRVFQLQELSFAATTPAEVQAAIKATVDAGKPIDEMVKALSARGVAFARSESQRPSEQLPLELLPRLYELQPGQGVLAGNARTASVVYLKAYEDAPVTEDAARPRIAQYLTNRSLVQNTTELVKTLRDKAKVEYVGEFSEAAPATPASPK